MIKDRTRLTTTSKVLLILLKANYYRGRISGQSLLSSVSSEMSDYYTKQRLSTTISKLKKKGWITYEYIEAKKIIKLTRKGELEALFLKARTGVDQKLWDGKWRLIIFDVPENARAIRDKLRSLLKQFGFTALQASVYVSPYPINKEGIEFLKQKRLDRYIRILRVDQMDNESLLLKHFKLR